MGSTTLGDRNLCRSVSELDGPTGRGHETCDSQTAKSKDEGHPWLSHSGRGTAGINGLSPQAHTAQDSPTAESSAPGPEGPCQSKGGQGAVMDADQGGSDFQVQKP